MTVDCLFCTDSCLQRSPWQKLCRINDNEVASRTVQRAIMGYVVGQRGAAGVTRNIRSSNLQRTTCSPVLLTVISTAQTRRTALLKCNSTPKQTDSSSNEPGYDYSDPVNRFLGQFLPSSKSAKEELSVDFRQGKLRGLSIEQMARLVEEGLSKTQWFVTGEVDPRLFSDDFAFKDESVATTGIKAYAVGVRKLFDQSTSKAELITVQAKPESDQIIVTWRLEGRVNIPIINGRIKPYVVTTTFGLGQEGLICSQLDEFSVPGWDLLLSALLGEQFGAKPAPPVQQLRKEAAAGGVIPVDVE